MGETAHQQNLWRHLALFILIFARFSDQVFFMISKYYAQQTGN
jgi:hypothetical protein